VDALPRSTPLSDEELVEQIRAGDQHAFDALVLAYCAELRRFVFGYVESRAAAEELVQDLFLNIWRLRAEWRIRTSLRSYLFRAARNVSLGYRRHEQVGVRWVARVMRQYDAPVIGHVGDPPDTRMETVELDAALERSIARLPTRCRRVATLRFQHDMAYTEIADVMGITVKAVERQIANALKKLRADLARYLDRERH
jgi:RNA polymerase sigma-70 factor (ECF subfamily)